MISNDTIFTGDNQEATINFLNTPRVAEWFANDDASEGNANEHGTFKDADDVRHFPAGFGFEHASSLMPVLNGEYLVKGLLAAGAMSVIYGPSNSGKTFLALDLAYRVAAGVYWHGRRVKQATVLYLATEGGSGLANRITALRDEHGGNAPFYVLRAGINLLETDSSDIPLIVDASLAAKEATGNDRLLIVVDTLSRAIAGGDENSSADMTRLVANVDMIRQQTGAHVLIVHHTGKDTARGARGHSSLRGAVDTEIEVTTPSEGDNARQAIVRKQRDYATGEAFDFALRVVELGVDQDGDMVTTCVAERIDNSSAFGDTADMQRCVDAIDAGAGNGEMYTASNAGAGSRWAGNAIMKELGVTKEVADTILKKLIASGRLVEVDYRSPATRKDRKGLKAAS